jgi:hypothetical protein
MMRNEYTPTENRKMINRSNRRFSRNGGIGNSLFDR